MPAGSTILATWLNAIADAWTSLGVPPSALRAMPRLSRDGAAPLELVNASLVRRLWWQAVEASGDDLLGLKVGQRLPLQALNVVGLMLQHAPDLRRALLALGRHQGLISNSGRFAARDDGGRLHLTYAPAPSDTPLHPAQVDSVCAGLVRFVRLACAERFAPDAVALPNPAIASTAYESWFRCPVELGADRARIVVARAWADHRIPGADPQIFAFAAAHAEALQRRQTHLDALSHTVRALIAGGEPGKLGCRAVAAQLGLGERTLQRRLAQSGMTYRRLAEQVRLEAALELLSSTEASLPSIAQRLGYSEMSAFSRAVSRRYGLAPSALRSRLRARAQRASLTSPAPGLHQP